MSRSGYTDDCDFDWRWVMYRGRVASAIRGKRGQRLLREALAALDSMPEKRLVASELEDGDGNVCVLGAVGRARGIDLGAIDPEQPDVVAREFDIAEPLACEIVYENDEGVWGTETPEERWRRMRDWVASKIKEEVADGTPQA